MVNHEREACLVEENGTVDDEEVVRRWHVAKSLRIRLVVEAIEKGGRGIDGFVDKSCIWSRGVDERHCAVGIVLLIVSGRTVTASEEQSRSTDLAISLVG